MANADNKDPLCRSLCDLLGQGEDIHRTVAAQALGFLGYAEAVPDLIKALLDEDEDVRTDAATALSEIGDARAAEPLMQNLLGDPCADVKLAAIDGLAKLHHADLAPWLRRMMKGKDAEIVWDEGEFYDTGWDDWVDIQVKVIKAIADFGDVDAVGDIVEAIDDEFGQDLSEIAFAALAKLGKPGAQALDRYAVAKDARMRRRAVTVLGGVDGVVASKAMSRALQDEAAEVRVAAGRAIAMKNREDKRLEMLLVDKQPEVRAAFVGVCGGHHPSRLAAMLFEKFSVVQAAVLKVLIAHPGVIDELGLKGRLIEILNTGDAAPAALAVEALMVVSKSDAEGLVVEKLLDQDSTLEVRLGAIKAITTVTSDNSLDALKAVLADDQRQVRLAAMTAIAKRSETAGSWPNQAGDVLLAALRGELVQAPEPQQAAETERAPKPAVSETIEMTQPLSPLSGDEPEEVAPDITPVSTLDAVLDAEDMIDNAPRAEPVEVELSDDDKAYIELSNKRRPRRQVVAYDTAIAPHQDVRRFAARLLGDIAEEDVAMGLADALAETLTETLAETRVEADKELTLTALDSLAQLGTGVVEFPSEAGDILLEMSLSQDADIRFGAAKALAPLGGDDAIARKRELLADDSSFVRIEAVRGLALHGAVDGQIENCLGDQIPAVRLAAAEALIVNAGPDMVRRLVDFAFEFEAFHVRPVAKLMAAQYSDVARALFLEVLDDPARKRLWKPAIEALKELGRPQVSAALAA